jgi:hypothetical protein
MHMREDKLTKQTRGSSSYLTNAAAPLSFCRKMLAVEPRVLDHPKAPNDLVFAQPCAYIPDPVLERK